MIDFLYRWSVVIAFSEVILATALAHLMTQGLISWGIMGEDINIWVFGLMVGSLAFLIDEIVGGIFDCIIDKYDGVEDGSDDGRFQ